MTSIRESYLREIERELGYQATWLPHAPLALGDIVIAEKESLRHVTTLAELGIQNECKEGSEATAFRHRSSKGVSVQVHHGDADSPGAIHVEFKGSHGIVLDISDGQVATLKRQDDLQGAILERVVEGSWDKRYIVITEVVRAASATILISGEDGASLELRTPSALSDANLAFLEGSIEVIRSRNVATQIICGRRLTPLFRGRKMKTRIFGGPSLRGKEERFGEVDCEDLLADAALPATCDE